MSIIYPPMIMHGIENLNAIAEEIIEFYYKTGLLNFTIETEIDLDEIEIQYIKDYIYNVLKKY